MKSCTFRLALIISSLWLSACSLDATIEDLDGANYSASTIEAIGPFIADGITPCTIRIYVSDKGEPVIGFVPIYKVSGTGNLLGQCSETNAQGIATCLLRSTTPGRKLISLVNPDTGAKTEVVFSTGLPAKAGFAITSGGGVRTTGGIKSYSSIGIVTSTVLLDDGGTNRARVGLQGVLYEGN